MRAFRREAAYAEGAGLAVEAQGVEVVLGDHVSAQAFGYSYQRVFRPLAPLGVGHRAFAVFPKSVNAVRVLVYRRIYVYAPAVLYAQPAGDEPVGKHEAFKPLGDELCARGGLRVGRHLVFVGKRGENRSAENRAVFHSRGVSARIGVLPPDLLRRRQMALAGFFVERA